MVDHLPLGPCRDDRVHPAAVRFAVMVASRTDPGRAVRLALVDDYEVVLRGVARMLEPYRDRIEVVEIDAQEPVTADVDIALYDTFAQPEADHDVIDALVANPHAHRVVVYTWAFAPQLIDTAMAKGAHGYLSKTLPATDLADALVAIHQGEVVVSPEPRGPGSSTATTGRAGPRG